MNSVGSKRQVAWGQYRCSIPLVRSSRLTSKDRGGIGKNLSEGWCINFAIGCTHGCPFCYVNSIHRRFGASRYGDIVLKKWGTYLLVPENIDECLEKTSWKRWSGQEVMLSSTHDPYLKEIAGTTRRILEKALPEGVRFCIQTRSHNVVRDLDLLSEYRSQVRIQVSIATMNKELARAIEPGVPPPESRLKILESAKARGITTGAIVAPILPPTRHRKSLTCDMRDLAQALAKAGADLVFGETLHKRGGNIALVEEALGEPLEIRDGFDELVESIFNSEMSSWNGRAMWWPDTPHAPKPTATLNPSRKVTLIPHPDPSNGGHGTWQDPERTAGIGLRSI